MNVSDLRKMLGLPDAPVKAESLSDVRSAVGSEDVVSQTHSSNSSSRHFRVRRQSMEQLDLIKVFLLFRILFCFSGHHQCHSHCFLWKINFEGSNNKLLLFMFSSHLMENALIHCQILKLPVLILKCLPKSTRKISSIYSPKVKVNEWMTKDAL